MKYRVDVKRSATKSLESLPANQQRRIVKRLDLLAEDPRPSWATKLVGDDAWRARVGDYRVVYTIDDVVLVVAVTKVAHRSTVYRKQ